MNDLSKVSSKIVEFPRSMDGPFLTKDMREHARLIADEHRLAALEMNIVEHARAIREGDESLETACERLRQLPATTRARLAARAAIHMIQSPTRQVPTPLELLETEASCLAEEGKRKAAEIREIERRILLQQPTSERDVQALLQFVTKLLESGRSVDLRPVIKALDNAARQAHPANTPESSEQPKQRH
ncbi:MAG: hypothetical protein QNJ20_18980 [Paracoccaceae bacterium]|nr:hypothetical protein [Paracoccaceae bacterium]